MKLGAFELIEPLPELNEPHAFASLRPWIDVGNVGTLVISHMEEHFKAVRLANIIKPGNYFDFTRYRPTIHMKGGRRELEIPDVVISYARRKGNDFIFLRLLEPHMFADRYIDSIFKLLRQTGVKRYSLIGSMYDMIPYTRPLLISSAASDTNLQKQVQSLHAVSSDYQGPTTIAYRISEKCLEMGTETLSLIVHLPRYFMVENDYRGTLRLLDALGSLYSFSIGEEYKDLARQQEDQSRQIAEQMIAEEPRLKLILNQLEANYDSRFSENKEDVRLSPEVEKFLQDMDRRFRQN